MTDQQRADSCPPWSRAKMPNLEKFAKESVGFSRTYCPSPHCCPTRASFFTSLYPSEHGIKNNVLNRQRLAASFKEGVTLWSDKLVEAGYELYHTGKWHACKGKDPQDFGWQQGTCFQLGTTTEQNGKSWSDYREMAKTEGDAERNEGEIVRPGYPNWQTYGVQTEPDVDDKCAAEAVERIHDLSSSQSPWCYFVGLIGPHDPYVPPQELLDQYELSDVELPPSYQDDLVDKPNVYRRLRSQIWDQLSEDETRECMRHYWAYCTKMDQLFGNILRALDASGQKEDTLVVFCSDHGDYVADHGLWCKGIASFDSAYRVPLFIRYPERIKDEGRVENAFVSLCDLGPTFLDAAEVSYDAEQYTGKSLTSFLVENSRPSDWRDSICFQCDGVELYYTQRVITTDKWKYAYNGFDFDELYDLENDPHEMTNLSEKAEYAEMKQSLAKEMWKFARSVDDTPINPYITVGLAPYGPMGAFD